MSDQTDNQKPMCFYLTETEFDKKQAEVVKVLEGVVVSQALAILRDCELLLCSTASVLSIVAVEPDELCSATPNKSPEQSEENKDLETILSDVLREVSNLRADIDREFRLPVGYLPQLKG